MTKERRLAIYNVLAMVCGIWFLLLGWFWTWYINVIIAYPIGILGFLLWFGGKKSEKKTLNKIAGYLLLTGLITSITTLFIFL